MERMTMSDTVHCQGCGLEVHPLCIGDTVAFFKCSTCEASFATTLDGEGYLVSRTVYFGDSERTEYVNADQIGPTLTTHNEVCAHDGETCSRTAHGYLNDAPRGTVQTLCADCGEVLSEHGPTFDASDERAMSTMRSDTVRMLPPHYQGHCHTVGCHLVACYHDDDDSYRCALHSTQSHNATL